MLKSSWFKKILIIKCNYNKTDLFEQLLQLSKKNIF